MMQAIYILCYNMMQICPIIAVDAGAGGSSTTLVIVIVIVIVIRCCWRVEYQMSQCLMCVRWYCRFKGDVLSCVAAAAVGGIVIAAAILVLHIIIFTHRTLLSLLLLLPLLHLPFLLFFSPYTMWTTKVGYACTSGYARTR